MAMLINFVNFFFPFLNNWFIYLSLTSSLRGSLYQIFFQMTIPPQILQKVKNAETFSHCFYKASNNLISKQKKHHKNVQTNIPDQILSKILNNMLVNIISDYFKIIIHQEQIEFSPTVQESFNIRQLHCNSLYKDLKEKNSLLISAYTHPYPPTFIPYKNSAN